MPGRKNTGFTLIEILVAVVLLGVVAAISLALLKPATYLASSRDARRKSNLGAIQTALEMYYSENNRFPADGGVPFGGSWSPYLKTVPNDPTSGQSYCYDADATRQNYLLCAKVERPESATGSWTCLSSTGWTYCVVNPY